MDTSIVTQKKTCVDCGAPIANYYAVRCRSCANALVNKSRRKLPADYHALAAQRGLEWLGPEVARGDSKTSWRCDHGHVWSARYSLIKQGGGCPYCNRHTDADYHDLAASKGYTWLGPSVESVAVKTTWQCGNGHVWETSYSNLRGCKKCKNERQGVGNRIPADDYTALAVSIDYKWLGPEVSSTSENTFWECDKGHTWFTNYYNIARGRRCFDCNRHNDQDYHALASGRGFLWVGDLPKNNKGATEWKCNSGHVWRATYNNIAKGSNCPECVDMVNGVRVSSQQRALCDMVGGTLNYRVRRYSVDVAVISGDSKIALEYDAYYWHEKQATSDDRKTKFLIRAGWRVVRIKGGKSLPTQEQINAALASGLEYCEIVLSDWGAGGQDV